MKAFTGIAFGLTVLLAACGGGSGGTGGGETAVTNTAQVSPGTLQFSAAAYSVSESSSMATVVVTRVNGSSGTLAATIAAANGTAVAGVDYTATATTITFADGDVTSKSVTIPLINDVVTEASEAFSVTLTSTAAGSLLTATVTIQDDDPPGSIQFSRATFTAGEGGGTVAVGVNRSNGSAGVISATISTSNGTAAAGQDYTATSTTVTFAAGDVAQKTISIPILSDSLVESDETFSVTVSAPTGGATLGAISSATVTIVANDQVPPPPSGGLPGSLQLSAATLDVNESGSNAVMTVSRVGGGVGTVTVRLTTANSSALAGQDYTAVNTIVTFANGDTTDKFVNVPILNDAVAEPAQVFSVTLTTPTGGATLGTPTNTVVTIDDNDPPPAPTLTLSTDIRKLLLNWTTSPTVTAYKLYANLDGVSGFTQVGGDLTPATTTFDIDVVTYKFNWNAALYRLEACNDVGCTGSASVSTINSMLDAIGYFKAQSVDSLDAFGTSIVVSGDGNTLAVGAPGEDSNATGINGNSANNGVADSGAVYVYARSGEVWSVQAYLKASNSVAGLRFGSALAISTGGNTLVVGAPGRLTNTGAAYVFVRSGTTWSQQTALTASNAQTNDLFGSSIGLSSDGSTMLVGAPAEASNATTVNGSEVDNSAPGAGAAYVFTRSGTTWSQHAYLKAPNAETTDRFGSSVAVSGDGQTVAVGAPFEDSDATTVSGNQASNAAVDSGAAYVFVRSGATWISPTYVKSGNSEADDRFGVAVSLSSDGNTLAVGANQEDGAVVGVNDSRQPDSLGCVTDDPLNIAKCESGAAYVFARAAGTWTQHSYIKSSNSNALDSFGAALALSGDGNSLIVGAINDDSSSLGVNGDQHLTNAKQSGAAYLFTLAAGVWSQSDYLKATNPNTDDVFGTSVAISGDGNSLAVGAPAEDSNAVEIGGNRADNSLNNSGAAYLY